MEKGGETGIFFSARASALVLRGFAARPSLVLSIYCHLKEEQGTARSLRSLVIASLATVKEVMSSTRENREKYERFVLKNFHEMHLTVFLQRISFLNCNS